MTYEELRADALALCADLSATADDDADLDPDSLKERRASEALSVLSGMPPAGGHVRPAADLESRLESRLESLYHAAVAEAETRRGMVAGGAAVVTDADMDGYAYTAAHDALSIAHAANAAWAEMTLVDE